MVHNLLILRISRKVTSREGREGRSPPPRRLLAKNQDARPIKCRFYQSQNAPKLISLSSKSKDFLGRGHSPSQSPTPVGRGTLPPHTSPPLRLRCLDPRAYGARLDSALDLGAYGASASVEVRSVDTCRVFGGGDAHFAAKEVELERALGNRLVQTAPRCRSTVQQQLRAGETAAGSQLVPGSRTSATVRVTWTTHAVHVRILQVRTAGNTVRTVLDMTTRAAMLRSLTCEQQIARQTDTYSGIFSKDANRRSFFSLLIALLLITACHGLYGSTSCCKSD